MPVPIGERQRRRVALVTLGCARNEVDSEELAGRLAAEGWDLVDEASQADVAVVNTCGFVEAAKKDSIDTVLEAADFKAGHGRTKAVVAVGCLAERYGKELAEALPEADAVLGFDDYADISSKLSSILTGERPGAHTPRDRRTLLPLTPIARPTADIAVPGHAIPDLPAGVAPASGPNTAWAGRKRLSDAPVAPLKLASGCDRRCSFCAIPSFRGAFLSRRPSDLLAEARWLAGQGVREIVLVSENSTSYGKDLGDLRLLEALLPGLASVDGIERVRVNYLQPAELRPGLIEVLAATEGVAPYFDISFQHSSERVLRRMRRFGNTERFLDLLDRIRGLAPFAGVRSNFIVGFPGETDADFEELAAFLRTARLDTVGVFGYSDEDGTEAAGFENKLPPEVVIERTARLINLAEHLMAERAEERVGEIVEVLVESVDENVAEGRAAHQAPEVDGVTELTGAAFRVGEFFRARVSATSGVDLVGEVMA